MNKRSWLDSPKAKCLSGSTAMIEQPWLSGHDWAAMILRGHDWAAMIKRPWLSGPAVHQPPTMAAAALTAAMPLISRQRNRRNFGAQRLAVGSAPTWANNSTQAPASAAPVGRTEPSPSATEAQVRMGPRFFSRHFLNRQGRPRARHTVWAFGNKGCATVFWKRQTILFLFCFLRHLLYPTF